MRARERGRERERERERERKLVRCLLLFVSFLFFSSHFNAEPVRSFVQQEQPTFILNLQNRVVGPFNYIAFQLS